MNGKNQFMIVILIFALNVDQESYGRNLKMIISEKMQGWHDGMSIEDSKNLAYWERNMLALMIAKTHGGHRCCGNAGWYHHGEYEGWSRVISIADGVITFHVPDDFDMGDLKEIQPNWDGHSTRDKWKFIMSICGVNHDNQ